MLSVDIVVSELAGNIVSAYDLDVLFNAAVLTPVSVLFSGNLLMSLRDSNFFPGVVDVAELSLVPDAVLAMVQGDAVSLFSIGFNAIADGDTGLGFVFDDTNDIKGRNAEVIPIGDALIPEPSAGLLFALGAAVFGSRLRRRAA